MRSILTMLVLSIVITACAQSTPVQTFPTATEQATATINSPTPSYEATEVSNQYDHQYINRITIADVEFSLQSGKITAKICYLWPGDGVWEIGNAPLKDQNGELVLESSREISLDPVTSPEPAFYRCIENIYTGVSDLSTPLQLRLEIQSVNLLPIPEKGKACQVYQTRLDDSPDIQNMEIEIQCQEKDGTPKITISKKPSKLTLAQSQALVDFAIGGVTGSAVFEIILK